MEFEDNALLLGQCACDAELFGRVWERMGVGEDASCPVEVAQPVPLPQPRPAPQAEERPSQRHTADDFPPPDDLPCLGSGSASHAAQLQRYIWEELEGWQLYRHLARRVSGPAARTLTALASGRHRAARRLAAAHFLIAGVRWWPTDRLRPPRISGWLGTLREAFAAEQRMAHRYRAAVCGTEDPCLAELYTELSKERADHADAVRGILEGSVGSGQ